MADPQGARILWPHQNFVSRAQAGNERAIHSIAAFLERGWHIDLITGTTSYQGLSMGDGRPGMQREGNLAWHRVAAGTGPQFATRAESYLRFFAAAANCARHLPRPDLVFSSTPPLPQVALAMAVARRHRVPLVLEVRDLWPGFLVETGLVNSKAIRRVLEGLESAAYRVASAVVLASPAFRPYVESFGVDPDRIIVAPHGAVRRDVACVREEGRRWRAEHRLEEQTLLLYAGSLNETHGLQFVLDAARHTHDCKQLVWLVAGNGRGRPLVEKAAREASNVVDLGSIPRCELDPILGAADAGIVALANHQLFHTVLPGKLVDYLSAGLPVICTIPGQPRRVVEASNGGWWCNPTAKALSVTALHVHETPLCERRRHGDDGARWVRRYMSAEQQGRAIEELCSRMLEEGYRDKLWRSSLPQAFLDAWIGRGSHRLDTIYRTEDEIEVRAFDMWLGSTLPKDTPSRPLDIPSIIG